MVKKFLFFPVIFLNEDSSFNIKDTLLKFSVVALGITMRGTLSQILYLGPSFCLMYLRKMKLQNFLNVSRFLT